MKIPSSLNVPAAGAGSVSDRAAPAKTQGDAAAPVAGASVRLSELSAQLVNGASGGDFDQSRVEAIKQAIADGKLSVNAENVADRLIANALALSKNGK
jgi:negative regulator of flagellin synthesis FlgM